MIIFLFALNQAKANEPTQTTAQKSNITPPTFAPPEIASGTVSCKVAWNENCEDQKTIKVPEEHKLCKNAITAIEQTGNSSYELISTDKQSITVKFHAKGNLDRFKQQGASIVLGISLFGVRDSVDCISGMSNKPAAVPVIETKTTEQPELKSETTPTVKMESKPIESADKTPVPPAQATPTIPELKPHACACSRWIDADKVFNCLTVGHGRDKVTCDSFATTIQCVSSKEACHESQTENCPQVMGLNRTESNKRLFVPDSPYCQKK